MSAQPTAAQATAYPHQRITAGSSEATQRTRSATASNVTQAVASRSRAGSVDRYRCSRRGVARLKRTTDEPITTIPVSAAAKEIQRLFTPTMRGPAIAMKRAASTTSWARCTSLITT